MDWTLICCQEHLHRVLAEDMHHYNAARTRSVELQPPNPAPRLTLAQPSLLNLTVQRIAVLGGLIHEYLRAA